MSDLLSRLRLRQNPEPEDDSRPNSVHYSDKIAWVYAREGLELMQRSVNVTAADSHGANLRRQLYIDGMGYLSRALPQHLTVDERIRIGVGLPPHLDMPTRPHSPQTLSSDISESSVVKQRPAMQLSFVRPLVAKITVYIILLLRLIMQGLGLAICKLYAYDRRHRISDWAIMQSVIIFERTWTLTASAMERVCSMNDGQVGEFLGELSRCLADEVSRGLYDGLGEVFTVREPWTQKKTVHSDIGEESLS